MGHREFVRWQAYDRVEPIGDRRLDYVASRIVAALLNVHRSRDSEPVLVRELMPDWWQQAGQSEEEIGHSVEMWSALIRQTYGGEE